MKNILIRFANGNPKPNCVGENCSGEVNLTGNVNAIISSVVGVLGIVAVIVIIIGGIQYMISAGDANKVKKAKDTILYGIIGLIVVILAWAIVNFVINNVNG